MKAGPYQAGRRPGASTSTRPQGAGGSPSSRARKGGSADTPQRNASGGAAGSPSSPGSEKKRASPSQDGSRGGGQALSRVSSFSDGRIDDQLDPDDRRLEDQRGLFYVIEQLAALEGCLWSVLDGLKSNATHVSYFCREYWGTSASQAQLSLDKLSCNERLKRQVQQACVLESMSLAVASHLCSGVMQGVSVTIRSRLRNLLYYVHENCLVLLDMVCQRWHAENPDLGEGLIQSGHCPENLNLDIMVRVKRYRRLRKGEHIMALRQHNEMIANVLRQLCRGATSKKVPLSGRSAGSPGDRSPGVRGAGGSQQSSVLAAANDILSARMPLDRLRPGSIRSKMLQFMRFKPLLNVDGSDPDCPWPEVDPFDRYGSEFFAQDGPVIWFEPLPPMLPNLEHNPKLPPPEGGPDVYTLVLDLDETLIHYFEADGMGSYGIRPGMQEFLEQMSTLGYELVIFTAATQDYADWVIDQIDEKNLIHHRLYRQHALPWGPIFVKDLSRLGRDLDRTLILDNVQENFMLQPHHGIFISTWYEDPNDTALFQLTPLFAELIQSRGRVPDLLEKYQDQIPAWAGFDEFSQYGNEYNNFDPEEDMLDEVDTEPPTAPPPLKQSAPDVQRQPAGAAQPAPATSYGQAVQIPAGVESAGGFTSSQLSSPAGAARQEVQHSSPPSSPPMGGMRYTSPGASTQQCQAQGQRLAPMVQPAMVQPAMETTSVTSPASFAGSYNPQTSSFQRSSQPAYSPQSSNVGTAQVGMPQQISWTPLPGTTTTSLMQAPQQIAGQAGPQRTGNMPLNALTAAAQPTVQYAAQTGPQRAAAAAPQLQMRPPATAFSPTSVPYQGGALPQGGRSFSGGAQAQVVGRPGFGGAGTSSMQNGPRMQPQPMRR